MAAAAFLAGIVNTNVLVAYISLRTMLSPDALLGRVGATARTLSVGLMPIGALMAGLALDAVGGATTMVAIASLLMLAGWRYALSPGPARPARRPRAVNAASTPAGSCALQARSCGSTSRPRISIAARVPDVAHAEDHVLRAGVGQLAEPVHDLLRALALAAGLEREPHALERRPLDLVGVAPDRRAVLADDLVLVVDRLGAAEDVGRVGVLGDQPEGLPLAAAADHDRDARAG